MPASTFTHYKKEAGSTSPSLAPLRRRSAQRVSSQSFIGVTAVSNGYTFSLPVLIAPCRCRIVALAVMTMTTLALNATHYWGLSLINTAGGILLATSGISNAAAAFTALTPREAEGHATTLLAAGDAAILSHVQVNTTPGNFPAAIYSVLWEEV